MTTKPIRHLELALAHHALGQLARIKLVISLQMAQANVGDLALLEEAVADNVLSAFLLAALDQTEGRRGSDHETWR